MSTLEFTCKTIEICCLNEELNNENSFVISNDSLILNMMNNDTILYQSEIAKKDAINLAHLILLVYEKV
jgi:hypothetical protein